MLTDEEWRKCLEMKLAWSVTPHGEVCLYRPGWPGRTAVASTFKLAYLKLTAKK